MALSSLSSNESQAVLSETLNPAERWFLHLGKVVIATLAMTSISGDLLMFATFLSNSSLQTRPNCLFASLILADFLLAVFVMPLEAVHLSVLPAWPFSIALCNIWNSAVVVLATSLLLSIMAMSLDKLYAVHRPLHYSYHISGKVLIAMALVWSYAGTSGITTYFLWTRSEVGCRVLSLPFEYSAPFLLLNVLLPYTVCVVTNLVILKVSRKQSLRVYCSHDQNQRATLAKRRKGIRTITLLIGVFSVFCLPFFTFHVVDAVTEEALENRFYALNIVQWLLFLNSSLNWALYGLLNREFRLACLRLITKTKDKLFTSCKPNSTSVLHLR